MGGQHKSHPKVALVEDRWQCGRRGQPHYAVAGNHFAARPEPYGTMTYTSSGTSEPTDPCRKVLKLLGMSAEAAPVAQIEKFMRCNGALGVIKAANAVARRRRSDPDAIKDPWAYCIQVFNGNVARSSLLHPMLYVLENALRSRVDAILTLERGRDWYRDVDSYLDSEAAGRFRKGEEYAQVQDRSDSSEPPYQILAFRSGMVFVQRIPFAGLQRIIEHNYASGPLADMFLPPAGDVKLDPAFVKASIDRVRDARNDVAHHREITPESFAASHHRARKLLDHLEFDVDRAMRRIEIAAGAVRHTLQEKQAF